MSRGKPGRLEPEPEAAAPPLPGARPPLDDEREVQQPGPAREVEAPGEILLAGAAEADECAVCLGPLRSPQPFPHPNCPHEYCAECLSNLLWAAKHDAAPAPIPALPSQAQREGGALCPQCRRPAPSVGLATLLRQSAPPVVDELAPEQQLLDVVVRGTPERRRCACISKFCLAFGSLACIVGCAVAWSFLSHIDYSI